jgi:hypothetical protein
MFEQTPMDVKPEIFIGGQFFGRAGFAFFQAAEFAKTVLNKALRSVSTTIWKNFS